MRKMRFSQLFLRRKTLHSPFPFPLSPFSVCLLETNSRSLHSLGVGAPLPEKAADGSWNRTELSSNDQLRKQLLGRNYDKFMKANAAAKQASAAAKTAASAAAAAGKTGSGASAANEEDDQDDDEDGRVSMVGKQKKRRVEQGRAAQSVPGSGSGSGVTSVSTGNVEDAGEKADNGTVQTEGTVKQAPSKGRKKATSYLDELLAERSKKRKKR